MSAPGISARAPVSRRATAIQPGSIVTRFVSAKLETLAARQFGGIAATDALVPQDNTSLFMPGGDFTRIVGGPLSWNHEYSIGTVQRVWTTAHEMHFVAEALPEGVDKFVDGLVARLKSGVPQQVSLQFMVDEAEPIDPRRPDRGIRATKWTALEISLVLVGADPGAKVTARAALFRRKTAMSNSLERAREAASLIGERNRAALEAHARGDMSGLHRQLRAIDSHIDALAAAHDSLARELNGESTGHDQIANPSAAQGAQVSSGQAARAYDLRQFELRALENAAP